ncbi:MAG TPA: hypothetical protein VFX30_08200 [bacterium]|nr:hypothetical protein [bacterium]
MNVSRRLLPLLITAWTVLSVVSCGGGHTAPFLGEGTGQAPEMPSADEGVGDDETILPQDPGAPEEPEVPEIEDEDDGPITPGKDLVVGGELAAGSGGGAFVSLNGTEDVHNTHLKMVRVHWKATASDDVEEIYIHAPFNRKALDGSEGDPCGKIDGRFLAVNDDGNNFNEGSPDAEAGADYLTGTKCQNNADCAGLSEGSPTPAAAGDFKASAASQAPQRTPTPPAPVCRIDLKGLLDKGVTEGEFFTFSHARKMRVVLIAKTKTGAVVSDERTWIAPKPIFDSLDVRMDAGRLSVRADYERAVDRPHLQGCADKQIEQDERANDGRGRFWASCAVSQAHPGVDVLLYGVGSGSGNFVKRSFGVQVSGGALALKDAGNRRCEAGGYLYDDCAGTLNLAAQSAPFAYTVRNLKTGAVVDQGETRFAGKATLLGRRFQRKVVSGVVSYEPVWEEIAAKEISEDGGATFEDVRRDHDHSAWRVRHLGRQAELALPYTMTLTAELIPDALPPQCGDTEALRQSTAVWRGTHVREIGSSVSDGAIDQPDIDLHDAQEGHVTIRFPAEETRATYWAIDSEGRRHEDVLSFTYLCLE